MLHEMARADIGAIDWALLGALEQDVPKAKPVVERMYTIEKGIEQSR